MTTRKRYSAAFKAKVVLEAIREELTTAELVKKCDIHPTMISSWKRTAIENMASALGAKETTISAAEVAKLHEDRPAGDRAGFFVGSLQSHSRHWRQKALTKDHPNLSLRRQCSLLSLARSSLYSPPRVQALRQAGCDLTVVLDSSAQAHAVAAAKILR